MVISVDAADDESARACEPFLDDERFSLVVQPERLDWHGNLNWLLQRPLGDFFCYRQHDDTTEPEFFQVLVDSAAARPDAAIVYADCQWHGGRDDLESAPSLEGDVLTTDAAAHRAEAAGGRARPDASRRRRTGRADPR